MTVNHILIICIAVLAVLLLVLTVYYKKQSNKLSDKPVDIKDSEETIETTCIAESTVVEEVEVPQEQKIEESVNEEISVPTEKIEVETVSSVEPLVQVRYRKSFIAQVVLQPELKNPYMELTNEFISYKKVKTRVSFRGVRVSYGKELLAKMFVRGKKVYVYYALQPEMLDPKYRIKDVRDKKIGEELPSLQKVSSNRSINYAKQIIAQLMETKQIEKLPEDKIKEKDFSVELADRTFDELLAEGLIVEVKSKTKSASKPISIPKLDKVSSNDVNALITDEALETHVCYECGSTEGKLVIINIGQISDVFNDGDVVTLEALKEKRMLPNKAGRLKVLANGILDKKLDVRANEFSKEAMKMIICMGGKVTLIK